MIVEALKVPNGFFIPMINDLKKMDKQKILMRIEIVDNQINEMEQKHIFGYISQPVKQDEFNCWEDEQVWGD